MKIAVIGGTGKLGQGLAIRALDAGHDVMIGSRDAGRAADVAQAIDARIRGLSNAGAAGECEATILSVPYSAHRQTIEPLAALLADKLVIDATVPIDPENPKQVRTESGRSAAEEAAQILTEETAVFAAFQTVSFHTLRQGEVSTDILVAGARDRKDEVLALIESFGLNPVYAGPLSSARYLEQMTLLLIAINRHHKVKDAGLRIVGID